MTVVEPAQDAGRRRAVLESAVETFAQSGFRGTSMDAVARAARISRPGLYFLFSSKEQLFREATAHVIRQDLAAVDAFLADRDRALHERLLDAFDRWAGRYVGPGARDVPAVVADNPDLVDDSVRAAPQRFRHAVTAAVTERAGDRRATDVAETLITVSIGLKHQVDDRPTYQERMRTAIDLVLPAAGSSARKETTP